MRTVTICVMFLIMASAVTAQTPDGFVDSQVVGSGGSSYITRADLETLPVRVGALERRPDRVGISSSSARRIAASEATEKAEAARVDAREHADKVVGEALRKATKKAKELADDAGKTAIATSATYTDKEVAKESSARRKSDGRIIMMTIVAIVIACLSVFISQRSSRQASATPSVRMQIASDPDDDLSEGELGDPFGEATAEASPQPSPPPDESPPPEDEGQ